MLEELGVPRTRVRIMRFFAGNGEAEIGVRELARALRIDAGNAQRELVKLARLGLVVRIEKREKIDGVEKKVLAYSKSKSLDDLCKKLGEL